MYAIRLIGKETSKSVLRRMSDSRFANRWFVGNGIDIGAGNDPLAMYGEQFARMTSARPWDIEDGDAQFLASVADDSYDFAHSSHCLEHLVDPFVGLRNWLRVIKPGGHVVTTFPDEDLYEQGVFPSDKNPDHKNSFTICKAKSWSPKSIDVIDLVRSVSDIAETVKIELLDASYRYGLPHFHQTATPTGECAIEIVLRKRPAAEIAAGGRLPAADARELTAQEAFLLTGIVDPATLPADKPA